MNTDVSTPAAEYFAAFLAAMPGYQRYPVTNALRLLGNAIGHQPTLADLAVDDAGQTLNAYMARRLYSPSTVRGYLKAIRDLQRRAAESVHAGPTGV